MRAPVALAAVLTACGAPVAPPGFDTPESALHDPIADVYLVSNVQGAPLAKDGRGYIARVQPDGAMERYWILGGRDGVTLHAPKGMALVGDTLWVADIDHLRRFDRTTGRPLGEVAVPGATFLNDVTAAPDGTVFVSDSGLDAAMAPTGTDAIWQLAPDGTLRALVKDPALGQPNGLVATESGVYGVSWRDGTFFQCDFAGRRTELAKAPTAQLDGLVRVVAPAADGEPVAPVWYATSWQGSCLYRFDASGAVTALPRTFLAPADAGFDAARRRLLVPLFTSDKLELLPL